MLKPFRRSKDARAAEQARPVIIQPLESRTHLSATTLAAAPEEVRVDATITKSMDPGSTLLCQW
jgi:hypothetical protein